MFDWIRNRSLKFLFLRARGIVLVIVMLFFLEILFAEERIHGTVCYHFQRTGKFD